jgi:nitrite reductase/ring-hydroxylating ferredoxin subunit/ferredoxin-thioredoxin reductase catalytic subunit
MPMDDPGARRRFRDGTNVDDLKAFMAPYVERLGYKFNTDEEFVDLTLASELGILAQTGDIYCPCRIRTGDPKADAQIVCPCITFHLDEFAALRKCWCGLFVRTDVVDGAALHGVVEAPHGPVDVRVAAFDDLADGQTRHVRIGKRDVAVVRANGEYFALSNVCRHAFGPLSEGFVDGYILMCPWHGWRYDVRDGTTDHPDADVRTYPVVVRAGEVFVTVGA